MTDIYLIEATPEYAEQVWQFRQEVFDYDSDNESQFAGCLSLDEAESYYVKGSFYYLSTYDCGSFVVNRKAVIGKEYNLQSEL